MAENYWYSSLTAQEIEDTLLGAVRFNIGQNLTTSQKAAARANIGAGEENSTFKILGYFASLADMQESLQTTPQIGDAYGIGTESKYDVYVYASYLDGEQIVTGWVNNGPIAYSDALIDDNDIALNRAWSSSKINAELSGKQNKIADSGILKGNGSGSVSTAVMGTDYGGLSFTVNLPSSGWSNGAQTISNANFLAAGFAFTVSPNSASRAKYMESLVYADDVTVDGQMTFHCDTTPDTNLTVNILRVVSA